MLARGKEVGDPRRPGNPWLAGAAIGIAISSMAAGAMMLGVGLALVQPAPTKRLPAR
jgi:hypothetical protein